MIGQLTLETIGISLVLGLSYLVLAGFVIVKRGLRRAEPIFLLLYLIVAGGWFLTASGRGLRLIWPNVPWDRVSSYLLLVQGILFWAYTRAFLQKRLLALGGWIPALIIAAGMGLLDFGVVQVPPFTLLFADTQLSQADITPALIATLAAMGYTLGALIIALIAYIRRASPLHRNRILYWLMGTAALAVGLALALAGPPPVQLAGFGLHFLGAALMTYIVVRPQLPDISTGMRRSLSYVFAVLIPATIAIGVSLGLAYLLSEPALLGLELDRGYVFGTLITAAIVLLFYRPVGALARRAADRLLFGRHYDINRVVSDYSQAVSQIISLEDLTARAMAILIRVQGVEKGTLLVIDEQRENQLQIRTLPGHNVKAGPRLILDTDSPLYTWLAKEGQPLNQYNIDVDPYFDKLDKVERETWRKLGMEVFLPIRRSNKLIGVLALGLRKPGRSYTASDLRLLATLADQTAVALENAALYHRVKRRAEQLELLNEIGRVITSALDVDPVVEMIASRIESALEVDAGFIFLVDKDKNTLNLQSSFGKAAPKIESLEVKMGQGLPGTVAQTSDPILITDLANDSRTSPEVEGKIAVGAKAAMCVPVRTKGETIGVILVTDPAHANLTLTDLSLLDAIASFATIAIENARQVAARVEKLRRQIEALQIQIDEARRDEQVSAITDTEYFRRLKVKAHEILKRRETRKKGKGD